SSVKHGRRCIAVRVFDHYGNGGFAGPASELYVARADGLGERIPLTGTWRYQVEREIPLVPNSVFQTAPTPPLALALQNAPASLFNGMIAPLLPCALRGAIWYQGESNVGRAAQYHALRARPVPVLPGAARQLPRRRRLAAAARSAGPGALRARDGHGARHRHRRSARHPPAQQARGRTASQLTRARPLLRGAR